MNLEDINHKLQLWETGNIDSGASTYKLAKELIEEIIPILLRALESAHKEWQEEYQNSCYEGGYSSLAEKNESLTADYWLKNKE